MIEDDLVAVLIDPAVFSVISVDLYIVKTFDHAPIALERVQRDILFKPAVKLNVAIQGNAQGLVPVIVIRFLQVVLFQQPVKFCVRNEVQITGEAKLLRRSVLTFHAEVGKTVGKHCRDIFAGDIALQKLLLGIGTAGDILLGEKQFQKRIGCHGGRSVRLCRVDQVELIGGQPSLGGFHHVVGEGRRRNKEDDAHKEADDGGSVFFPVSLIVLAGKDAGESEQLVGEL